MTDLSSIAGLLPEASSQHAELRTMFLKALEGLSRDLIPYIDHPYAEQIVAGTAAFPNLLKRIEDADLHELPALVDAICQIIPRSGATDEVCQSLAALTQSRSPTVQDLAFDGLALAREQNLMGHQYSLLWSEDFFVVDRAVQLIGLGRHESAVPRLLQLLCSGPLTIRRRLVWALGEVGSSDALPLLYELLEHYVLVAEVAEALGKIGHVDSIPKLLSVVAAGVSEQRGRAVRALGQIIHTHRGQIPDPQLRVAMEQSLLEAGYEDESPLIRYHALAACAHLGLQLERNRVMAALGAELPKTSMSGMSAFFVGRGRAHG